MNAARTILLVEDDANDVFFLKYAFEAAGIAEPLQVVEDGRQAIDYRRGAASTPIGHVFRCRC